MIWLAKNPCTVCGNIHPSSQTNDGEAPQTELTPADFAQFFQEMWGHPPFDWQQRLAERVMSKADPLRWPEAITLPTAAGKTACIDIAIFALAAQAHHLTDGRVITAPRRIFFVVDRRIIVDQAYNRAQEIFRLLQLAKSGMVKEIADRLRKIAHGTNGGFEGAHPLTVHVLRGGMYRSESWAHDPLQPTVVASTVDQIGSRLLFRAYGRSSGTWPVYAGLVANDSIVFLDEAHCAKPFLQTLQAVSEFRKWASKPLGRSFYPVVMSATPPPYLSDVFADDSEESKDPDHLLGKRYLAHKYAKMKMIAKASGADEMSSALVNTATGFLTGSPRAIVVFTNRVATAREAFHLLNERQAAKTVLLTGRMRQVDRDRISAQLIDLTSARSDKRSLKESIIVIATQTLEVGADLDFDDLVTECASLDALRQRFGRLNRTGRPIRSRAEILVRKDQAEKDNTDPIYGTSITKTWSWLDQVKDDEGRVDFGTAYLDHTIKISLGGRMGELTAPSLDAPVMLPAHVDYWAQTGPAPHPSPDIAPFLRGPERGVVGVQICWRADLDLDKRKDASLGLLKICPPSSVETLTVPIGALRGWLMEKEHFRDNSSDIEGMADDAEGSTADDLPKVVRWRGNKTSKSDIISNISEIAPGDIIVVPADHPAPHNRVGDFPFGDDRDELDVGDQAHLIARAKCVLRLHPNLTKSWPPVLSSEKEQIYELLDRIKKYGDEYGEIGDSLNRILEALSEKNVPEQWAWLPNTAKNLLKEYGGARMERAYKLIGEILVIEGKRRLTAAHDADVFSDEDDSSSSSTSYRDGRPVELANHLEGVGKFAYRYAQGCGLPEELASALECSGLLHDLGKADPRFQSMLHGGSYPMGVLLAKSARMPRGKKYEQVREEAKYPKYGRHELLTMRLVESTSEPITDDQHVGDLILHLVGSHHGYCRPFAPAVSDDRRATTSIDLYDRRFKWSGPTHLEKLDSGVSDRYWRLTRRYGWWGLAWIESILRLADWRRSEWEEENKGG